jgi:peptide/nickel transport system ATP-binding protein
MITHDLGVATGLVDRVNALYAGRIVERGDRHPLFAEPRHPYTHGLLASIPRLDGSRGEKLTPIPGSVSDNLPWASACAFAPRCSQPIDKCVTVSPRLEEEGSRALRCHNPVDNSVEVTR